MERTVLLCYVVGAPGAGKNALLDTFLSRPSSSQQANHTTSLPSKTTTATGTGTPSTTPLARRAVNSVELPGGRQIYLILSLLPTPTNTTEQLTIPHPPDLIAYTYDSSDPTSFAHIPDLLTAHPQLGQIPAVFAALKADKDRAVQRGEVSPEKFCEGLGVGGPRHVSVRWESVGEFFGALGEVGVEGKGVRGKGKGDGGEAGEWVWWSVGVGVVVGVAGVVALGVRRGWVGTGG